LPQLWLYGSWAGLFLAVASAAILNLLLLGSFGWSELIAANLRTAVWVSGGGVWLIAVGLSVVWCRRWRARANGRSGNDVFAEAVNHYLRGDYFQAELALQRLLRANLRDLDARLMLATLMRRTGRTDEATQQLDTLVRFDGAARWEVEVEQERELLAEAKAAAARAMKPAEPTQDEQAVKVAPAA
jgi:tetratricopeptide (TPR) repeat protein